MWGRPFTSATDTVAMYRREAAVIRRGACSCSFLLSLFLFRFGFWLQWLTEHSVRVGLEGDLDKAFKDGKPIIIEGTTGHLSVFVLITHSSLSVCICRPVSRPVAVP
jgi:hypothetical protein